MESATSGILGAVAVAAILGIWATVRKALSKRYHSPVDKLGEKIDALVLKVDDIAGGQVRQLFGHSVVVDCLITVLINQKEGRANGTTEDSLASICRERETHREYLEGRR